MKREGVGWGGRGEWQSREGIDDEGMLEELCRGEKWMKGGKE